MTPTTAQAILDYVKKFNVPAKTNVDQSEGVIKVWLRAIGWKEDNWGNFLEPGEPKIRYHFKKTQLNKQRKDDRGDWVNSSYTSSIDSALSLIVSAAGVMNDQEMVTKYAKSKGKRREEKQSRAESAEEKRQRAEATAWAWKEYASQRRGFAEKMLQGKAKDEEVLKAREEFTPMQAKWLQAVKDGTTPKDDQQFATADSPPILPVLGTAEYSWTETVDGVEYTVEIYSVEKNVAEISIGSTQSHGIGVSALTHGIRVLDPSAKGDAYIAGKIFYREGYRAALFMIMAGAKQKGAGSRALSIWCRLMSGYGVKAWVAEAVGADGAAFFEALEKKGKLKIHVKQGPNWALECIDAQQNPAPKGTWEERALNFKREVDNRLRPLGIGKAYIRYDHATYGGELVSVYRSLAETPHGMWSDPVSGNYRDGFLSFVFADKFGKKLIDAGEHLGLWRPVRGDFRNRYEIAVPPADEAAPISRVSDFNLGDIVSHHGAMLRAGWINRAWKVGDRALLSHSNGYETWVTVADKKGSHLFRVRNDRTGHYNDVFDGDLFILGSQNPVDKNTKLPKGYSYSKTSIRESDIRVGDTVEMAAPDKFNVSYGSDGKKVLKKGRINFTYEQFLGWPGTVEKRLEIKAPLAHIQNVLRGKVVYPVDHTNRGGGPTRKGNPTPAPTITLKQAQDTGRKLGVNWKTSTFDAEQFRRGMQIELEHGDRNDTTNLTGDELVATAMIALAHLNEHPDYYYRLDQMEAQAEQAEKGRTHKPHVTMKKSTYRDKPGHLIYGTNDQGGSFKVFITDTKMAEKIRDEYKDAKPGYEYRIHSLMVGKSPFKNPVQKSKPGLRCGSRNPSAKISHVLHKKVFHVGTMTGRSRRPSMSLEGPGLSVSMVPNAWMQIAELGRSQLNVLTRKDGKPGKFIDLTGKKSKTLAPLALEAGFLQSATLWRFFHEDEDGSELYSDFPSQAKADKEMEDGYGGEGRVEKVQGYVATPKLKEAWKKDFTGRIPDALSIGLLYTLEAIMDFDGAWWNEDLDPWNLSAPRGVIFRSKLREWTSKKIDWSSAPDAEVEY